ncbi:hypothetical protein CDAR_84301 [Caerostris darwini]|uniref:Uncharacterized protein n=1 Tax=Caerostris darwini TaxID=1538125 RepID=A0AAV4X0Z8_9ARAC|nr:hypothetical protein CDAR_84301 [Caerostris darwini]
MLELNLLNQHQNNCLIRKTAINSRLPSLKHTKSTSQEYLCWVITKKNSIQFSPTASVPVDGHSVDIFIEHKIFLDTHCMLQNTFFPLFVPKEIFNSERPQEIRGKSTSRDLQVRTEPFKKVTHDSAFLWRLSGSISLAGFDVALGRTLC